MKIDPEDVILDETDRRILALLQENCKQSLSHIGKKVGLSASSVMERVHKLEEHGVIIGYRAVLNAHHVGKDVVTFIGVSVRPAQRLDKIALGIGQLGDVLECHHVTGDYTLMVKAKTESTGSLEGLISAIRALDGVEHTQTMVVLSTHTERTHIAVAPPVPAAQLTLATTDSRRAQ